MGKEQIIPAIGEVNQQTIEMARQVAQMLQESGNPREELSLKLPDGREIEGTAFQTSDGRRVILGQGFLAIELKGRLTQFTPLV